jgi:hypothetical protein
VIAESGYFVIDDGNLELYMIYGKTAARCLGKGAFPNAIQFLCPYGMTTQEENYVYEDAVLHK